MIYCLLILLMRLVFQGKNCYEDNALDAIDPEFAPHSLHLLLCGLPPDVWLFLHNRFLISYHPIILKMLSVGL